MKNTKILLVDDDPDQLIIMKGFLENQGYIISTCKNGRDAVTTFKEDSFSIVVTDLKMPEMTGDKLLFEINQINPTVKKIMITAYADVKTAVEVMKSGADDFIEKPVDLDDFLKKIKKLELEYIREEESLEIENEINLNNLPLKIIGKSKTLKEALLRAGRVALKDWTVLLNGETGTGKELFARLIHLLSSRKDMPFIEVNCASIPENLFESELFGHKKGAFTGADKDKKGMVEMADKGTLFLDEIGEMPVMMQAKMLRFLQEGRFQSVGGNTIETIDVRIIAATNRDLENMVSENLFREDLYYRLSVLDIKIPALRDRKDDIPFLIEFFLEKYGAGSFKIDNDAMNRLINYDFQGNVRELEHLIQKLITFSSSNLISREDLPPEIKFFNKKYSSKLKDRVSGLEKEMIMDALKKSDWNQTKAAKSLDISERVLRYKMAAYSIKKTK